MAKTYEAILRHGQVLWLNDAPHPEPDNVRVSVVIPSADEAAAEEHERQRRLREALEQLAKLNPFRDIEDPVEWQREIRKDRPLPGRD